MSYTPPAVPLEVSWEGSSSYTAPNYAAVDANWLPDPISVYATAPSPLGQPAVVVGAVTEISCWADAPSPLGAPSVLARSILGVRGAAPSPLGTVHTIARLGWRAWADAPSPLGAPSVLARVIRYELRGEIRDQGVLVNRRVRAYRLSDGALAGEADTVGGQFRVHVGFAPALHYIIPLDLAAEATDYAPPAANRVMSVLAED